MPRKMKSKTERACAARWSKDTIDSNPTDSTLDDGSSPTDATHGCSGLLDTPLDHADRSPSGSGCSRTTATPTCTSPPPAGPARPPRVFTCSRASCPSHPLARRPRSLHMPAGTPLSRPLSSSQQRTCSRCWRISAVVGPAPAGAALAPAFACTTRVSLLPRMCLCRWRASPVLVCHT